jgi:hypothetical protein
MSVDIEDWMTAAGLDRLHYVADPTHGAVRLNVGELRAAGLKVGWDPDGGHRFHGAVLGAEQPQPQEKMQQARSPDKKRTG